MSAADASNVVMDAADQVNGFLLAGILAVGGFVGADGRLDMDVLRAAISDRLTNPASDDLARFSQRVHGGMEWEHCQPDLSWHVRLVGAVQGRQGLADVCGTLMTVPLSLDRPLWELLVVPGASPGGPGVILRVHHAVADGVAGVRLVQCLFGSEPTPKEPAPALPDPPMRSGWRTRVRGVSRVMAVFRATVAPTVLLGPIGHHRGVAFSEVELPRLARASRAAGATVNDALLAAAAVAVEATLRAGGQAVPRLLPASVPVALSNRGSSGNAVGVMLVPLPMGEPDAGLRLSRIAAATRSAKAEARSQGTFELTRTRWGSRMFARLARRQRFIALFVTNVHGPDQALRVAGAPLTHAWPVAPLQGNVRFGVAAMSYAGRFGVAVHVDAGALRVDAAGHAMGDELTRLAARGDIA